MNHQVMGYSKIVDSDVDKAIKMVYEFPSSYMKLDLRFQSNLTTSNNVFITVFELINKSWFECGRTEIVEPGVKDFIKNIPVVYYFERNQIFHIAVSMINCKTSRHILNFDI